MRILASSDLHGFIGVYERLPLLARTHGAEAVVLAGDLLGAWDEALDVEDAQRASAREIVDILEKIEVRILYIMGNDDWVELEPRDARFRSLHGKRVDLGSWNFVGYQYSLPFMGGIFEKPEAEIEGDLTVIEPLIDDRTVLVTHSPAWEILDVGMLGIHAGSRSIRAVTNRRCVRAHIHGHIHGCFGREDNHFNVASAGKKRAMVLDLATMRHTVVGEDA